MEGRVGDVGWGLWRRAPKDDRIREDEEREGVCSERKTDGQINLMHGQKGARARLRQVGQEIRSGHDKIVLHITKPNLNDTMSVFYYIPNWDIIC